MSNRPILDQILHVAAGAVATVPIGAFGFNPLTGAWATFCMGAVREYTEWQLNPLHGPNPFSGHGAVNSAGSKLDLAFWTLAGFLVGFIPLVLR